MPPPRRPPRARTGTSPRGARVRTTRRSPAATPSRRWSGRAAFTSRAAVLAVVVCAVLLSLAYPLREYFAQRGEIERLRAQQRASEQRVAALERQQQRWREPAYIKAQARQRLHFVMPGEIAYVVLDPNAPQTRSPSLPVPVQPDAGVRPWYAQLWRTVEAADRPMPAAPKSGP